MPELAPLFAVAAKLLKRRGRLFILERHPMLDMFDPSERNDPPVMSESYFRTEPIKQERQYNYWTKSYYDGSPMYKFHHKLSDVIGACMSNGFLLIHFEEFPLDVSEVFAHFKHLKIRPPLSYALVMELHRINQDSAETLE